MIKPQNTVELLNALRNSIKPPTAFNLVGSKDFFERQDIKSFDKLFELIENSIDDEKFDLENYTDKCHKYMTEITLYKND